MGDLFRDVAQGKVGDAGEGESGNVEKTRRTRSVGYLPLRTSGMVRIFL